MLSMTTTRAVVGAALISLALGACVTDEEARRDASWEAYRDSMYEQHGKEEGMKAIAKSLGMTVDEFKAFEASGVSLADFYARKRR